MATRFCCLKIDGTFGDCTRAEFDMLPDAERELKPDGSACGGGGVTTTTTTSSVTTTTTTSGTRPPAAGYTSCSGYRTLLKKTCKDPGATRGNPDPNGLIYKVQGCIGVSQDGFFGKNTESALMTKIGRKDFMPNEVSAICTEAEKTEAPKVLTPQEQEAYWQDLVDRELISRKGTTLETKSGIMYVVKTEKDNPDLKIDIEPNSSEWDPEQADYYLLVPIEAGRKSGKLKKLVYRTTVNDETKRTFQPLNITWEPDEEMEYVAESRNKYKVFSNKLNRILSGILNEQKIGGGTSTKPSSGSSSGTMSGRNEINLDQQPIITSNKPLSEPTTTQQTTTKQDQPQITSSNKVSGGKSCREKLVDYIVASTNTDFENSPLPGEKIAICDCYQTGEYDEDMILTKDDFLGKVTKERSGFNMFNRRLNMREIRRMFNEGKNVAGFEINQNFKDRSFLQKSCRMSDPRLKRGGLGESIKSHVKEAINKKKTLTESIVNKIARKIG